MSDKAVLMYCCRSSGSTSECLRALQLAKRLSENFDVTVVLEEPVLQFLEIPPGVSCITLPGFDVDPDSDDFDVNGSGELRARIVDRRSRLLEAFERLKPRICIVEAFPFRQRRLRGEILPLVERARNGVYGESLVVALTDGIVPSADDDASESRADEAARVLNRYFDLVLVHSDPVFARLEEFFRPQNRIDTPTYHVGFIANDGQPPQPDSSLARKKLLVSAGDGRFGGRLFQAAVEAHKMLWPVNPVPMKIIAGERLPGDDWQRLLRSAEDAPNLSISRSSMDFPADVGAAGWSISHCGYDTAVNMMTTDTPSLFVPSPAANQQDQLIRAQRLVYWGRGRLMPNHIVNGASLATEISELTKFNVRPTSFDLDGVNTASTVIEEVIYNNRFPPIGFGTQRDRPITH